MTSCWRWQKLCEKYPVTEFFLVRIFPYLDWIRRFTKYIFHAVRGYQFLKGYRADWSIWLSCWFLSELTEKKINQFELPIYYRETSRARGRNFRNICSNLQVHLVFGTALWNGWFWNHLIISDILFGNIT